jgi:hypothetical protein
MPRAELATPYNRPDTFRAPDPLPYKLNSLATVRRNTGRVLADVDVVLAESAVAAMPVPAAISRHMPDRMTHEALREERQPRPHGRKTKDWIDYFDANWQQEKLPQDWYNLQSRQKKHVGFMMNKELNSLDDPYDKVQLAAWVQKVKQNLAGAKLEVLSDKVVYPRLYQWNHDRTRLEDPQFGKAEDGVNNVDITEGIDMNERKGVIKGVLQQAKEFFASAPDGSTVVISSPAGPTGLKDDKGNLLDYDSSYFIVLHKTDEGVTNYSIKTNFSLNACREAIRRFSGIELPKNAPMEAYVEAAAFKKGKSLDDVIHVLADIQPAEAYYDEQAQKVSTWEDVRTQIGQGEMLYAFDVTTASIIEEFGEFALQGIYSKDDLHKGIAAAFLQMSDIFFKEVRASKQGQELQEGQVYLMEREGGQMQLFEEQSFGSILDQAALRPGCAGGGKALVVQTMSGTRIVIRAAGSGMAPLGEDGAGSLTFTCKNGHSSSRHPGEYNEAKCVLCNESTC